MPRFIHLTGKKRYGTNNFGRWPQLTLQCYNFEPAQVFMLGFGDDFFTFSLFMRNPKMVSKQTFRIDNTFTLDDVSFNFLLNTFRFFHSTTIQFQCPSYYITPRIPTNRNQFFEHLNSFTETETIFAKL